LTYQIPDGVPATLNAGDTWQWTVAPRDFPPGQGFTLSYQMTGKTAISFTPSPSVALGNYSVAVAAATTTGVASGPYRWLLRATDGAGVVTTVDSGHVTVNANTAVVANTDGRSHPEKMLALVEAELEARVKGDGSANVSYSIEGRSISKMTLEELYKLRGRYRSEVARQRNGGKSAPVVIAFGGRRRFGGTGGQWDH
jgi:hypothetical protein